MPTLAEGEGKGPRKGLLFFYAQTLLQVLRPESRGLFRARVRALTFFVAAAVHAFAHAALALAAGRCAALLAGAVSVEVGVRSSANATLLALQFGALGLVAATVKTGSGVVAAHGQARVAGQVGGLLRLQVLDDWFAGYQLRRPRQHDHGPCAPPPPQPTLPPSPRVSPPDDRGRPSRTAARGVSALTARVTEVETGLAHGLLGGARAVAQLVPLAVALVLLSPRLALAAFVVLLPFGLVLSFTRTAWRRAHGRASRDGEELLEAADEAVRHADLWVSYSAEPKARAVVAQLGERLGERAAKIQATSAAMSGANEVLAAMALVLSLAAAHAGWLGDVGDSGRLLGFTVCFFLAYRPIRDLTESRLAWSRASLAYGDLTELAGPRDPVEAPAAVRRKAPWGREALRVDRLVLRRGTSAPISFVVPAGTMTAIVGSTGEGKTTLVRTLLGLEDAESGDIYFGAACLRGAAPGLHERPFAWVPQDAALLNETLEANVALGCEPANPAAAEVLGALGAGRFAIATSGKRLGPGGVVLSGGERQWVAVARAFATAQPVLVLDEPTSGLDHASQATVLEAVARLRGKRSVVLITHRPEPLLLADQIVRLTDGKVTVGPGPRAESVRVTRSARPAPR